MISEAEKKRLRRNARIQGLALAVIGVTLAATLGFIGSVLCILFVIAAAVFAIKGPEYGEMFLIRQANLAAAAQEKAEEFKDEKRGIVWVWIVALLTWAIMAIAYFSLSMVVYIVLDQAEAFIPWGSAPAWADGYMQTITLTRNVCAWFLIIMTVGIIGWALINSARRTEDTGPAY